MGAPFVKKIPFCFVTHKLHTALGDAEDNVGAHYGAQRKNLHKKSLRFTPGIVDLGRRTENNLTDVDHALIFLADEIKKDVQMRTAYFLGSTTPPGNHAAAVAAARSSYTPQELYAFDLFDDCKRHLSRLRSDVTTASQRTTTEKLGAFEHLKIHVKDIVGPPIVYKSPAIMRRIAVASFVAPWVFTAGVITNGAIRAVWPDPPWHPPVDNPTQATIDDITKPGGSTHDKNEEAVKNMTPEQIKEINDQYAKDHPDQAPQSTVKKAKRDANAPANAPKSTVRVTSSSVPHGVDSTIDVTKSTTPTKAPTSPPTTIGR